MNLTIGAAIEFVRARLDELSVIASEMLVSASDNTNLDTTIEKCLEEAVFHVLLHAPAALMEGSVISVDDTPEATADSLTHAVTNRVLDIDFGNSTYNILRLLNIKCGDSDILVTEAYEEGTPQSRMQFDGYNQGQPDDPCLVLMGDSVNKYKPHYKYFTTDLVVTPTAGENNYLHFKVVYQPVPTLAGTGSTAYYVVPQVLAQSILNYLTGTVLTVYKEDQHASIFFTKANEFLNA